MTRGSNGFSHRQPQTNGAERLRSILVEAAARASFEELGRQAGGRDGDENLTDAGNARRFLRLSAGTVKYVVSWRRWAVWDGMRWDVGNGDALASAMVRDIVGDLHRQAQELEVAADSAADEAERKQLLSRARATRDWAFKTENGSRFANVLEHAAGSGLANIHHEDFDTDPWLLNCLDGTIDLRTGELRPHNPDDLITRLTAIHYEPEMPTPFWDAHLDRVACGDAELIGYLQRAVGYSLTGLTSENVLFILYGSGANGKSTTLEVLRMVMGEYADTAAPDLLLATGERHPTELADLYGRRFVYSHEVQDGGRLAEAKVKRLTGNDRIKARRMREDFWSFSPTHKFWLGTNHKPIIYGTDHAIWRRIRLIPFSATIPAEERDPDVLRKLRGELPGILGWAVRGCLEWQRRGLGEPAAVREATEVYRAESDVMASFLTEHCVRDVGATTTARELYEVYKQWAEASGERVVSRQLFGRRLAERGVVQCRVRSGHSAWRGIRLRRGDEPCDASWGGPETA
jgi:putative DNA primase/helicase